MRIIPDNCPTVTMDYGTIYGKQFPGASMIFYGEPDVIEITDDEWEEIYAGFDEWETDNLYEDVEPTFAQYLRKLIELKR